MSFLRPTSCVLRPAFCTSRSVHRHPTSPTFIIHWLAHTNLPTLVRVPIYNGGVDLFSSRRCQSFRGLHLDLLNLCKPKQTQISKYTPCFTSLISTSVIYINGNRQFSLLCSRALSTNH